MIDAIAPKPPLTQEFAMIYGQLVCATGRNIGNEIQSVAAARHLPRIDTFIDQEQLHLLKSNEPICGIMNAWFMITPCWPPSPDLRPIFVGFHVTKKSRALVAQSPSRNLLSPENQL